MYLPFWVRALQVYPNCPGAVRPGIGHCHYKLGHFKKAWQAFEQILQLDPENAAALVALAVLDLQTNEAEICLISWERPAPSSSRRWRAWSESDDDEVLERKPQASPVGENSTELQESDVEFREDVDI
ncbi:protein CTR9 homolog [Hevea brasiliensis]|uniref:protein CTR9 homolog n=1 Tax=Hevea brasiliensis TaxID=3981 RepID=UPI000B7702AB|nr:protein CTR9 homolog [Hevea brasiliensis]XP_021661796.1 protein CTR9 homolog [Hevea brasiliensis]XP_021661797.1 protein CTR9 homolog [Hevea brasiliensis]XP_021661798.1 protein CTR9 homolog [Hevea brasiliensis]XP_021661799.1 protein CTR9 homolog [Hevea brasiliensis]XP_058001919.1 protein CTR9 homolog [Hevea brasiliensis]XP_058001921.1 protein CTR9 homolog [Hevea brasiliensis]XP_058001922.1 protein CTR9 homolog [Hevea brasiliensis]XP_058001923.1 protein CTR9 homolog [Hevea brasiliensis]XP